MTLALSIKNLHKVYNNGFEALKGISLNVQEGDFFALLGPNGAGKSTTLGIVSSLVKKSSGDVSVFGHSLDTDITKAKMNLGVVPQEFNFNTFENVQDILVTQAGYYGISKQVAGERADYYLHQLGLWEKRNGPALMLSGGMKRRLMIARALIHDPKLLILDEPTAGVDIELRRSMWEFLRELNASGTTIILTTHYLEEAENLCRNIAIIDHGTIVQDTSMRELLQQLNTETILLDIDVELQTAPVIEGYTLCLTEGGPLEVEVTREQGLNSLFCQLEEKGLSVMSMRNKANRLEELFVSLIKKNPDQESLCR